MTKRIVCAVVAGLACGGVASVARQPVAQYEWQLPTSFPKPRVPSDNPMTTAKAELGRYLFYDTRLSGNGTQACATCHEQALAFTDARAVAIGSTQERHPRGSMSLVNVAYSAALTWANPTIGRLEDQAFVPMFGDHPIELGLRRPADDVLARLRNGAEYQRLFPAAFEAPTDGFTVDNIVKAIATFERTIISARSPYDRYHYDRQDDAISPAAKRGEQLFFSSPLSCFRCHNGFAFSGAVEFEGRRSDSGIPEFHNTGLYNLAGAFSYPASNTGLYETTKQPGDVGKFKAPTLRNIAVTAPYMHDGSIATLDGVLDHYAAGGRTIADGPYKGVGHDNPNRSPAVRGFTLTGEQRADLIAFLASLTDDAVLHDPRFANPWTTH
jgi:cytochrome c peroxidase